jgi:hypothetical protein
MADTHRAAAPAAEAPEDGALRAHRLAESLRLPFEPLDQVPPESELWGEVPLELLARFSCVPLRRAGRRLVLAFGGLEDIQRVDELEYLLGRPIDAVVAPHERVSDLLRRHKGGEILLEQASESLRLQLVAEDETSVVDLESLSVESPIVRLVDSLIVGAIDRASSRSASNLMLLEVSTPSVTRTTALLSAGPGATRRMASAAAS